MPHRVTIIKSYTRINEKCFLFPLLKHLFCGRTCISSSKSGTRGGNLNEPIFQSSNDWGFTGGDVEVPGKDVEVSNLSTHKFYLK